MSVYSQISAVLYSSAIYLIYKDSNGYLKYDVFNGLSWTSGVSYNTGTSIYTNIDCTNIGTDVRCIHGVYNSGSSYLSIYSLSAGTWSSLSTVSIVAIGIAVSMVYTGTITNIIHTTPSGYYYSLSCVCSPGSGTMYGGWFSDTGDGKATQYYLGSTGFAYMYYVDSTSGYISTRFGYVLSYGITWASFLPITSVAPRGIYEFVTSDPQYIWCDNFSPLGTTCTTSSSDFVKKIYSDILISSQYTSVNYLTSTVLGLGGTVDGVIVNGDNTAGGNSYQISYISS